MSATVGSGNDGVPQPNLMQDIDPAKARVAAAKTIRQRMKALDLSRQKLSQRTSITVAALEALEQGGSGRLPEDPHWPPKLKALAEVLQLPVQVVQAAAWRPLAGQGNTTGPLPTGGTANQFRCDLSGTPW